MSWLKNISGLEDRLIEIIQSEEQQYKRMRKNRASETCGTPIKYTNIYHNGSPKRTVEGKKEAEVIFQEIMAEPYLNLMLNIQKAPPAKKKKERKKNEKKLQIGQIQRETHLDTL